MTGFMVDHVPRGVNRTCHGASLKRDMLMGVMAMTVAFALLVEVVCTRMATAPPILHYVLDKLFVRDVVQAVSYCASGEPEYPNCTVDLIPVLVRVIAIIPQRVVQQRAEFRVGGAVTHVSAIIFIVVTAVHADGVPHVAKTVAGDS